MEQLTFLDLLAQETKRDPIAFSARLRAQGSLHRITSPYAMGEIWMTMNYDDAVAILKDPRFIKDQKKILPPEQTLDQKQSSVYEISSWRRDLLMVDPPDHTRLRSLVSRAFTPRMIEQLRPRIQQITDELIDAVQDRGQMDVITDFAFPLPITVICELLGIPLEDRQQFRVWTQMLVNLPDDPQQWTTRTASLKAFIQYIKDLLAQKRTQPGKDLTSALVQVEEQGDVLSEVELISMLWLLIIAGHETTVNLIGNGILALLQHPEQLHLLQQDRGLLPSAIEELLRYTAPVLLSTPRWASEDVLLHDTLIHKGEMIFVSLIAADSDPAQFSDPASLDITREENQHLAFGKGIHFCLGAPLARLEGQIAIGTLLQHFPNLQLACKPEELTWTHSPILHDLTSLPVTF